MKYEHEPNHKPALNQGLYVMSPVSTACWSEELGRRVFPFDAFISHNRSDTAFEVVRELRYRNVAVWYDAHANMADRKVSSAVSSGLSASRYVVVCVGGGFHDSPWAQAEYLPALTVAERYGVTRTVVLRMDAEASIPNKLTNVPMYDSSDLDSLSSFFRAGNLLSADPNEVFRSARTHLDHVLALLDENSTTVWATEGNDVATKFRDLFRKDALFLEQAAVGTELSAFEHLREIVEHFPEALPPPSSKEGIALRRIAIRLRNNFETDNRANGVRILHAIDDRWQTRDTLKDLTACLSLEKHQGVVGVGLSPATMNRMTALSPSASLVVTLRCSNEFALEEYRDFVSLLPEPVRCRVGVDVRSGKTLDELPTIEELSLLREQLTFVIASLGEGTTIYSDEFDLTTLKYELVLIIYNIHKIFLDFSEEVFTSDRPSNSEILENSLSILEQIVSPKNENHLKALLAASEWGLGYLICRVRSV